MKNNRRKYILSDGSVAVFSCTKFKKALLQKKIELEKYGNKHSQQMILDNIAETTSISVSTIKHWSAGHNAPSDLDKVRDVAKSLNVEMNDLLERETEDNFDMNNKVEVTENIDYGNVKNVIRSIYIDIVDYIEMFRMAGTGTINLDSEMFKDTFVRFYTSLLYTRLDLPKEVFEKLCSFSVNYLQQLGCYLEYINMVYEEAIPSDLDTSEKYLEVYTNVYNFPPCAPWSDCLIFSINFKSDDCKMFESAVIKQYELDQIDEFNTFNEVFINTAYGRIEEILKDYLVK